MRFSALSGLATATLASAHAATGPVRIEAQSAINSRAANLHIDYDAPLEPGTTVAFTYGPCNAASERDADHVVASRRSVGPKASHRLVWVLPKDLTESGGCVSAWDHDGQLLGRSEPMHVEEAIRSARARRHLGRRQEDESIDMTPEEGFDVYGPWFDGVAALESKDSGHVDVEAAKSKEIAIVGAGMSGLMTYLVLSQAGFTNLTLLEASSRLGGRVHTEYLTGGPEDYSYQEMGPMRIPKTVMYGNTTYNISDQVLFFQLADELNRLNGGSGHADLAIKMIPFIQNDANALMYFNENKMENGLPPTVGDVSQNPSLGPTRPEVPESAVELAEQMNALQPGSDFLLEIATNMWSAHSHFIKNGGPAGLPGDQWSEYAFLVNYLNGSVADANAVMGGNGYHNYLEYFYYSVIFASSGKLETIDGGMNRMPLAFHPIVDDDLRLGHRVERIKHDNETNRLTLSWRGNYTDPDLESADFDYAVVATPFTVARRMRLPPLPYALTNAIQSLPYSSACKVALEYRTRFWEKFDRPIYGSCSSSTDIPGIGSICYPSYNINGTGPATLLASYEFTTDWSSVPEEQHVQYVINAMIEIHGEVAREEYTGKYNRKCWTLDEFTGGAGWASPAAGAHEAYMPDYFKVHKNMIFVGEHTSVTHAWIAAALESGLRGGVQLLLDLGLVDEAKETVEKWVARFISIVSSSNHQQLVVRTC